MPPLAAAIAPLVASWAASFTISGLLTSLATSIVLGGLQKLLMPTPKSGNINPGLTTQVKQPIMNRKPVYGEIRLSGGVLFVGTSNMNASPNRYLHYILSVAPHEIDSIGEVWLNDYSIAPDHIDPVTFLVNTGRYSGKVMIKKYLGGAGQAADATLLDAIEGWSPYHTFDGIAYLYIRLEFSTVAFPTGVPNVSAWVKGKKLLDTRTAATSFSNNIPLIVNDYLKDATYGLGAVAAEIDDTFLQAAANTADEMVTTAAVSQAVKVDDTDGILIDAATEIITIDADRLAFTIGDRVQMTTTGVLPAGISALTNYFVIPYQRKDTVRLKLASSYANALAGTSIDITDVGSGVHTITKNAESRYAGGVVLDSGNEVAANIEDLLTGMSGRLVFCGGTYRILAGSYPTPTIYFDENDIVSPISLQTKVSRRERFNNVHGVYVAPINDGQPSDYPAVTNATYITEDNGETIIKQIDFPVTQRPATAQRLAKIELEKSRQEMTWTADFNLSGMLVQAGDNIYMSVTRFGWTNKIFEVVAWSLEIREDGNAPRPVVNMTLRETASAVWDWNSGEETTVDPAPNSDLPDVYTVIPPGSPEADEYLFSTRDGGGVKAAVDLACSESSDYFVESYQFRYKLITDTEYITLPPTTEPSTTIFDIAPGVYTFEARAINTVGVPSTWSVNTPITIYGLSAPPAAITGLSIQAISSFGLLRWDLHPDLDVREGGHIYFRHSPASSGVDWSTSVSIGEAIPGQTTQAILPLKAGTYLARAYDSSNIPGPVTTVYTDGAVLTGDTPVTELIEQPDFSGTHSNTVADNGLSPVILKLTAAGLFDDIPDFDAVTDLDSYGGLNTSGVYAFHDFIDLLTVQTVRLESHVVAYTVNTLDTIDDRTTLIDDWESFDGTTSGEGDVQVWIYSTNDDPDVAPVWSAAQRLDVGEYTARAFKAEARLSTTDSAFNIYVEELEIAVTN